MHVDDKLKPNLYKNKNSDKGMQPQSNNTNPLIQDDETRAADTGDVQLEQKASAQIPQAKTEKKQGLTFKNNFSRNNRGKGARSGKKQKIALALVGLLIFVGGTATSILITQKQQQEAGPIAPSAPQSKPSADIGGSGCSLTFDVTPENTPTVTPSATNTPTPTSTVTPTPTGTLTPTPTGTLTPTPTVTPSATPTPTVTPSATPTPTSTPTPTPTPKPMECASTPCDNNDDCNGDLVCVTADDGENYCSMVAYVEACQDNPSYDSCCTAPTSTPVPPSGTPIPPTSTTAPTQVVIVVPTNPPYSSPVPTQPGQPQTYIVETKPECNDVCSVNSDCANISHICYNGRCRLDVNPEDENCQLPSGETQVERVATQPQELYQSGPKDWLKYLKAGIGALGAGLLLLLFL